MLNREQILVKVALAAFFDEHEKLAQRRGPGGHVPDTSGPPPHGRGMGPGGGRQDRSGLKGWKNKSTHPGSRLGAKGRSRLARQARKGKDIGKKGKRFEEVARKAAKRYGSMERGRRVAAAAMMKARAKRAGK